MSSAGSQHLQLVTDVVSILWNIVSRHLNLRMRGLTELSPLGLLGKENVSTLGVSITNSPRGGPEVMVCNVLD